MFNFRGLAGQKLGQYELRELIGITNMSAVYLGFQDSINRFVAVKVMNTDINPDIRDKQLERFFREARIAAALEHPNIVPIFDFGSEGNIHYVVMRLLRGGSLEDRIQQRLKSTEFPSSLHEAAAILQQIGGALDHAHERSLVHRDIKPNNIMFDVEGRAYLVDFGIAKALDTDTGGFTIQGVSMGTASYMAPEQWRGDTPTVQIDQYALAAVMYYLVAGKGMFDVPDNMGHVWMYKHLHEAPAPIHEVRPNTPPELSAIIQRALAKDPTERYADVTEFSEAFTRALRNVPKEDTGFFTFPLPEKGLRSVPATPLRRDEQPASVPSPRKPADPMPSATFVPSSTTPPPSRPVATASFYEPSIAMPLPVKRSRTPLIIGIIVVLLLVAAGVAAFILSRQNPGGEATPTVVAAGGTPADVIIVDGLTDEVAVEAAAATESPVPATDVPAASDTPVATDALVVEDTAVPTDAPTDTDTPTEPSTPTDTATDADTPTATATDTDRPTDTATATATERPTDTLVPTATIDGIATLRASGADEQAIEVAQASTATEVQFGTAVYETVIARLGLEQVSTPASSPANANVQNGSFEDAGSTAWQKVGEPEIDCSGSAFEGSCVAKVDVNNQLWQRVEIDPTLRYTLTVAARSDAEGANLRMQIEWYDAGGTLINSTGATQPVSAAWSEYVLNQIEPPENAAYAQIYLRSLLEFEVLVDGVNLERA